MHPLLQLRLPSLAPAAALFRAPVVGPLRALVAEHIVRGRVVFPGAAYLEMARASPNPNPNPNPNPIPNPNSNPNPNPNPNQARAASAARAGARGTSPREVGISLSEIFFLRPLVLPDGAPSLTPTLTLTLALALTLTLTLTLTRTLTLTLTLTRPWGRRCRR